MSARHVIDVQPVPEKVLFVNEPQFADQTAPGDGILSDREKPAEDNVRIYVPLDINREAILRRLRDVYWRYGFLTEANEFAVSREIDILVSQIEIFDQIWSAREGDCGNGHSQKATQLVKEVLKILMTREGNGEIFPYELVETLCLEYGLQEYRSE